jgi:hypothetical protein
LEACDRHKAFLTRFGLQELIGTPDEVYEGELIRQRAVEKADQDCQYCDAPEHGYSGKPTFVRRDPSDNTVLLHQQTLDTVCKKTKAVDWAEYMGKEIPLYRVSTDLVATRNAAVEHIVHNILRLHKKFVAKDAVKP